MSLASGTRLGPYEITEQIGGGGMGEVYKALDTRLNRFVAIKTSREKYNERFEREMRAIASLSHPNICVLHDVGPDFIVMELLEGQTLQQLLQSRRLTRDESIRIAEQMAEALHAAHAKGVTHRDIKPSNVFVSPRGHVKVLDFGLAKVAAEPRTGDETQTMDNHLSTPGQAMGTAPYMAPEQARGIELDARADIWALGVVFYEMLTGSRPFDGTTLALVYDAILNRPVDLAP
jgi:serine/threonine protein kinase